VLLKKGVEEEDLSLREKVHVERSKCDGVDGRRKGFVGRAEGLSSEKDRRIRSASFHSCCEGRQQRRRVVSGSLRSDEEDAGVMRLKDGNGRIELTPSSLEFWSVGKGESIQTKVISRIRWQILVSCRFNDCSYSISIRKELLLDLACYVETNTYLQYTKQLNNLLANRELVQSLALLICVLCCHVRRTCNDIRSLFLVVNIDIGLESGSLLDTQTFVNCMDCAWLEVS
jgi:hypothetical protein